MKVDFGKSGETEMVVFQVEFKPIEALEAGVLDKLIELGDSAGAGHRQFMALISEIVVAISETPGIVNTTRDHGHEAMMIPCEGLSEEATKAASRVGTIMSTACGLGICETCKGDPCQHACHAN